MCRVRGRNVSERFRIWTSATFKRRFDKDVSRTCLRRVRTFADLDFCDVLITCGQLCIADVSETCQKVFEFGLLRCPRDVSTKTCPVRSENACEHVSGFGLLRRSKHVLKTTFCICDRHVLECLRIRIPVTSKRRFDNDMSLT